MNLRQRWQNRSRRREHALAAASFWSEPIDSRPLLNAEKPNAALKTIAGNLRAPVDALVKMNQVLASRLQSQMEQLERLRRLRKFVSPQVADVIITGCDNSELSSERREISALFCDLRGFTAFSDSAQPEAVLEVLRVYHQAMGELIDQHGGTIEHRAGDGIMVIFNAPMPCRDPAMQAVRLALAMKKRMCALTKGWKKLGYELGFGVGMSLGYATVGTVGSEGRLDYVANGRVVNLASRLSDEAADGQVLLSERAYDAVRERVDTEFVGELELKGFRQQVKTFNVLGLSRRKRSASSSDGDQGHAGNNQQGAAKLDWSQWLAEEEVGHY